MQTWALIPAAAYCRLAFGKNSLIAANLLRRDRLLPNGETTQSTNAGARSFFTCGCPIETSPGFIARQSAVQLLAGTFEHAHNDLLDCGQHPT